jgi:hypothetical protein
MRWHCYLQLKGAHARAAGQRRERPELNGRDIRLWLQGYDAMDRRIGNLLGEIKTGWLASQAAREDPCSSRTV